MQNGLNVKVEIKDAAGDSQAAVMLVYKGEEKSSPANFGEYSKEIAAIAAAGLISGKLASASIHLVAGATPPRLIVIGMGDREKESVETGRAAGGALARLLAKHLFNSIALLNPANPAAFVSGLILGGFEYTDHKGTASKDSKPASAVKLRIVGKYSPEQRSEINRAAVIAESQNYARTIASRPGNDINPPSLAKAAQQLAKDFGLGFSVLDEKKMKQMGMGGMIGVGAGSNATPPRMIVLEYTPKKKSVATAPLLVVGKAITFDTGGISIKQAPGMQKMVFDKCGGMAVLGMMRAISLLELPIRVVGILASAENHISETAYRPGDILNMYNGITVEVISTDAEGRLVLGDALSWGIEKYKPSAVVDLATLTGGVVVALGKSMAGLMSNSDAMVSELQSAANAAGEKIWRLPIGDEHREALKSNSADICNSGVREAAPLIAGAFLSFFVPREVPWAHLDIAGVAAIETPLPYYSKGATGWGVRTLVEWVTTRAAK